MIKLIIRRLRLFEYASKTFFLISLIDNLTGSVFLPRINQLFRRVKSHRTRRESCNCTEACTWTMEMVKGPFTSKAPYFGKVWRWSYLMTPSSDTISRICTTRPATRYAFLPINYLLVWIFFPFLSLRAAAAWECWNLKRKLERIFSKEEMENCTCKL